MKEKKETFISEEGARLKNHPAGPANADAKKITWSIREQPPKSQKLVHEPKTRKGKK